MKIYAITHTEKNLGVNPSLTEAELVANKTALEKIPWDMIRNVIVGTGKRFQDVLSQIYEANFQFETLRWSPLIGSADSKDEPARKPFFEQVFLADGTQVLAENYLRLVDTPGIDLWAWLISLNDCTLLCTEKEFIVALGEKAAKVGTVYEIDTKNKAVTEVV